MPLRLPEKYRKNMVPTIQSQPGDQDGTFLIPHPKIDGYFYFVVVSAGMPGVEWEHVSVSLNSKKRKVERCPTWEEMCWIKDMFFTPETPVIQIHPPLGENVSMHNYCLHLWYPTKETLPLPPSIAVGLTMFNGSYK